MWSRWPPPREAGEFWGAGPWNHPSIPCWKVPAQVCWTVEWGGLEVQDLRGRASEKGGLVGQESNGGGTYKKPGRAGSYLSIQGSQVGRSSSVSGGVGRGRCFTCQTHAQVSLSGRCVWGAGRRTGASKAGLGAGLAYVACSFRWAEAFLGREGLLSAAFRAQAQFPDLLRGPGMWSFCQGP